MWEDIAHRGLHRSLDLSPCLWRSGEDELNSKQVWTHSLLLTVDVTNCFTFLPWVPCRDWIITQNYKLNRSFLLTVVLLGCFHSNTINTRIIYISTSFETHQASSGGWHDFEAARLQTVRCSLLSWSFHSEKSRSLWERRGELQLPRANLQSETHHRSLVPRSPASPLPPCLLAPR